MNGIIIDESGLLSFKSSSMLHGEWASSAFQVSITASHYNYKFPVVVAVVMIAYSSEMMGLSSFFIIFAS